MSGYFCKYTPVELLCGFGKKAIFIQPDEVDFEQAEQLLYPSVCSFAKGLLQSIQKSKQQSVLFTDCCDAIKRVYDLLLANSNIELSMFDLPRTQTHNAVAYYAVKLKEWVVAQEKANRKSFDVKQFLEGCAMCEEEDECGGYIGIVGARVPRHLLEQCEEMCTLPIKDLTCGCQRRAFGEIPKNPTLDTALLWYAGQLLGQTPCMRMVQVDKRSQIFEDASLKAVIYHTVKFCDFYGFEYSKIKFDKPAIKIETDFTPSSAEQIKTRIEAFFENHNLRRKEPNVMFGSKGYYVGVDTGSTSTNVVIVDENQKLIATSNIPTGAKTAMAAQKALEEALSIAKIQKNEVLNVVGTGYGRKTLPFDANDITEITCHAKGAYYLFPKARTVIDIGGQDSKVIKLDKDGAVAEFAMNDKCAAGTGRFLELMATTLGLDMETMSQMGKEWSRDISISSMCAVFAESEVISLIAKNIPTKDIIRGINLSIAARIAGMVRRQNCCGPFVMTGGVAGNYGVVQAISEKIGQPLLLPEFPQICGALGAALLAVQNRDH